MTASGSFAISCFMFLYSSGVKILQPPFQDYLRRQWMQAATSVAIVPAIAGRSSPLFHHACLWIYTYIYNCIILSNGFYDIFNITCSRVKKYDEPLSNGSTKITKFFPCVYPKLCFCCHSPLADKLIISMIQTYDNFNDKIPLVCACQYYKLYFKTPPVLYRLNLLECI